MKHTDRGNITYHVNYIKGNSRFIKETMKIQCNASNDHNQPWSVGRLFLLVFKWCRNSAEASHKKRYVMHYIAWVATQEACYWCMSPIHSASLRIWLSIEKQKHALLTRLVCVWALTMSLHAHLLFVNARLALFKKMLLPMATTCTNCVHFLLFSPSINMTSKLYIVSNVVSSKL